ncbi:hypothetical protein VTJ49DRAFT_5571 [Mycothermus thermophilus]|uniref:G-protein coupled receptors family 2 profile 2 domain-containing protein n=1 Tax=Humicola insolens TaxID=85995 RepID=A0ABR3V2T8_HUMIN
MADAGSGFDDPHVAIFSILERACSVLSMVGSMFVITTFSCSKLFHKPINRLVFYATIGNLMANVGTLMSTSFTHDPTSPGCQIQAFLLQMFMPADALWMLSMAINVHLTFYFSFDARRLRKMEVPYLLCCYGIPFIVSLTLVFIETPGRGRIYGSAKLWCWITPKWNYLRVALFYGPVWIIIFITFAIYIRAGREIYNKHKSLKEFRFSTSSFEPEHPPGGVNDPFSSVKTTEVHISSEMADRDRPMDMISPEGSSTTSGGSIEHQQSQTTGPLQKPPPAAYSVTISSNRHQHSHRASHEDVATNTPNTNRPNQAPHPPNTALTLTPTTTTGSITLHPIPTNHTISTSRRNNSTTTGHQTLTSPTSPPSCTQTSAGSSTFRRRSVYQASKATWSYTKCALLFFTALCVTWIPSSASRVYSLAHGGNPSLPLQYVAAFVLPLQGFWNAIIYVTTSWGACRMLWADLRDRVAEWKGKRRCSKMEEGYRRQHQQQQQQHNHHNEYQMSGAGGGVGMMSSGGGRLGEEPREERRATFPRYGYGYYGLAMGMGMGTGKADESESMTELAVSRSHHSSNSRPGSSVSPDDTPTKVEGQGVSDER